MGVTTVIRTILAVAALTLSGTVSASDTLTVYQLDGSLVEVFKYDGSLQCDRGKALSLEEMAGQLTDKGIEVKASRKGNDGRVRIAMCGASTGRLNVYTIPTAGLPKARELGFELLVTPDEP